MKKIIVVTLLLVLMPGAALAVKGKSRGGGTGKMSVQVRSTAVKSSPDYLSTGIGTLTYGAEVIVVGTDGNWYQIDSPSGWLPKSVLTKSKLRVNPDQKFSGAGARHDEVALAGKGFNPQVEANYKKSNPNLSAAYAAVDRMEGFGVTEGELRAFRRSGKLR